jgi:hypothetical protein
MYEDMEQLKAESWQHYVSTHIKVKVGKPTNKKLQLFMTEQT